MWFFYLRSALSNPGQLPCYTEQYNLVMKQVIDSDQDTGRSALGPLCHKCQLLRPLRAEHCSVTNHCVAAFDRYCPIVSNTIGYNNRGLFLLFLVLFAWNCWVISFLGVVWLRKFGFQAMFFITVLFLVLIATVLSLRVFYTLLLAMANLTTFETKNYKQLSYLRVTAGHLSNPFHREVKVNLLEYFHFVQPLTQQDIKTQLQQNQA
ncbi:palmitoyltransferase ZDHHC12-like [Callorhinchus milii]|uniref:palmitoyltransferase ZDHHC12-like n=1 Tax=Callorhinchus milii TaxID=7868 RepID=UPI0004574AB8|nr:palmitoyltransferase ZDHHC12-like [Callorhinchus milii]|eukprot:gi/632967885/ref/XP_007900228.1/ PREDICTED: probable palmitoyltransferase ZDHHC12 [Callorhinchus milii]